MQNNNLSLIELGYSKDEIDKFINTAWQVLRENDSTIPSDVLDAFKRVLQNNLDQDQSPKIDFTGFGVLDDFNNLVIEKVKLTQNKLFQEVVKIIETGKYGKLNVTEWHELSKELPPYEKDGGRDHYSLLVQFPLGTVHEALYYGDNRFYLDGKRLENVVAWALLPRPYLALVQDPSVTMLNQLKY